MKPEAEGARPKPSVCRRLFADEDPADQGLRDNMFNQITEQINRSLDDACNKYNFDFRSELPLEGDWTWERITPEGEVGTGAAQAGEEPPTTAPQGESEGPEGTQSQAPPTSDPQAPPSAPLEPPSVPQ